MLLKWVKKSMNQKRQISKNHFHPYLRNIQGILAYEDMMHLVKCNRYHLVCGSKICSSMTNDEEIFDLDDLFDIGFKKYLLNPSKQKKDGR